MRVLLDTHIMLWSMCGDPRLTSTARAIIENENNELYFSSASLCEISLGMKVLSHDNHFPDYGDFVIAV